MPEGKTENQFVEALFTETGEWITLQTWDCKRSDYDAAGWLDRWGEQMDCGVVPLPNGGCVDLSKFCAIRGGEID